MTAWCLTPDGKTLYATTAGPAAAGKLHVIDAAKFERTGGTGLKL